MKIKSKADGRFKSDLAFLDMLFNMLMAFSFLFLVAFLLIKPHTEQADKTVKLKAEYVLTLTWPAEALDDVDLWLMTPDGEKIMYSQKEGSFVTLDRDDRGAYKDVSVVDGQIVWVKDNREMMTIRAIVPGRYVVAAFMYTTSNGYVVPGTQTMVESTRQIPYEATIEMLRLNPTLSVVATGSVQFTRNRQEKVFFAFTVAPDGTVAVERDAKDTIVSGAI
jgi:hypothetical protein